MSGALAFSTAELAAMQATQAAHMMDRCIVQAFGATAIDGWGVPGDGYTNGSEIWCGFDNTGGDEVQGESEVATYDATVRLPLSTAVTNSDRIRLTQRHGTALAAPRTFEIIRIRQGASGLLLELEEVTDGT